MSATGARRRSRIRAATVATGLVVAAAVTFGVASRPSAQATAPVVDAARPSASGAPTSAAAPAPTPSSPRVAATRVTIAIDPQTRLVLVEGTRRDERPLSIELGADGSASIDLVGASGKIVRRTVTRDDDGTELSAEAPTPSPARAREAAPARARQPRAAPKSEPLLRNPY